MLYKKKSIRFNNEQTHKYSNSRIAGTGYLAFRDIEIFCLLHKINFSKVLDLGCGAGRSTKFLANHCGYIVGTDISKEMLALAANVMPELNFYLNDDADKYKLSPFSAIFSILMFFHFSNIEDMKAELQKCYRSLENDGSLIVINGMRNLYIKNYLSVKGVGKIPEKDGDLCEIELKAIDCKVQDYFWTEKTIIDTAELCGLTFLGSHYPLGQLKDLQKYKDEYKFAPYYYLAFKKI